MQITDVDRQPLGFDSRPDQSKIPSPQSRHVIWMPFVMKEDKTLNPIKVGSLGADAIASSGYYSELALAVLVVVPCFSVYDEKNIKCFLRPFARWDINWLSRSQRRAYADCRDIEAMISSPKWGNI